MRQRRKFQDWILTKKRKNELHQFMTEQGIFFETMCLSAHRKYPLGSADRKVRKKSLDIMRKAIVFARDLGIRVIQLAGYDVYYEKGTRQTRKNFHMALKAMCRICIRIWNYSCI